MRSFVSASLLALAVLSCGKSRAVSVAQEPYAAPSPSASSPSSVVASAPPSPSTTGAPSAPSPAPSLALAVAPAAAPRVTFARIEKSGSFDEHLVYPRFTFDDAAVTRDVNGLVAKTVRSVRDDFAGDYRQMVKDRVDDGDDAAIEPRPYLALSCDVGWASNDLVAIGCDGYSFVGDAHGNKFFQALDVELPSMRVVKQAAVAQSTSAARTKLRALCEAKIDVALAAEGASADPPSLDDAEEPLDFGTFVFRPRGIQFEFKNQFAFVIADVMHCELPYSDLASILVPGGPASRVRAAVPHVSVNAPVSVWDARAKEDGVPDHP